MKYHEFYVFLKDKKAFVASLHKILKSSTWILICLYLPRAPSGFVKLWVNILMNCGKFKGTSSLLLAESLCVLSAMNSLEQKEK
jgi:hypothetical protein